MLGLFFCPARVPELVDSSGSGLATPRGRSRPAGFAAEERQVANATILQRGTALDVGREPHVGGRRAAPDGVAEVPVKPSIPANECHSVMIGQARAPHVGRHRVGA